ncbi:MAG: helix-hairpin-helix domain-containing protein [Deltaproteobacteria bacterium]|nr:helix-hairpin-helix domain-containing protein [Deltaproteobacteria bacterium]
MYKVNFFKKMIITLFVFAFACSGVLYAADTMKVDLNKATLQELTQLKGIGEKFAERIIEYREQNGKFQKIEDLMKVKGIGQKKFDAIKDLIVVKTDE